MPAPTNSEIIDGLQSIADTLGKTVLPKPISSVVDQVNAVIDIDQNSDGTFNGAVSTTVGVVAGIATAATLEAITIATSIIALETFGPTVAAAVFYQGQVITFEIASGVQSAASNAALDLLNSYRPGDFSPMAEWMLDFFDGLVDSPENLYPVSNAIVAMVEWFNNAFSTPIVLDLNNNGIEYIKNDSLSSVFFDIDADGFAEKTEWIKPTDGFLVRDTNGNGRIDSQAEMFGDNGGTSAYAKLALLNSNNTGASANAITSADTAAWNTLRVWQDTNSNGKTDAGELTTLLSLGITSIGLQSSTATSLSGRKVSVNNDERMWLTVAA